MAERRPVKSVVEGSSLSSSANIRECDEDGVLAEMVLLHRSEIPAIGVRFPGHRQKINVMLILVMK